MLWFAAAAWLLLAVLLGPRLVYQRDRFARMVWLFPLVTGEIPRPRLSYDARRLATAFPLGMYAACSFATGQVTGITGIADFGRVWTWAAFTVTLLPGFRRIVSAR